MRKDLATLERAFPRAKLYANNTHFILAALKDFFRVLTFAAPSTKSSVDDEDGMQVSIGTIGVRLSGWTK